MSEPSLASLTRVRRVGEDDEVSRRPLELKLYKRMFRYTSNNRRTLRWLLVCVVARAIQLPVLSWLLARVLNGPVARGDLPGLYLAVGIYAAVSIVTDVVCYYRIHLAMLLGEGVVHDLRNHLFAHLQTMSMGFFNKTRLGRTISRFTSDAEAVRSGVQDAVFGALVNGGCVLGAATLMLWFNPRLFLVTMLTAPIYFLVYHVFRRKLSDASRAVQESFSRVTATLAESVTGIRVTQGFARQDLNAQLFAALAEDHSRYNMDVARAQGMFLPLIEMLNQCVIGVLFGVGAYLVFRAHTGTTVADLILFYFLTSNLLMPLAALGTQYNMAVTSMAGAERVFGVINRQPDLVDPPDAIDLPPLKGKVEFRDLSFAYDPGKLVLHEVNFTAHPGQTVALVGHTGSGKSSIINLISKFYVPTGGKLLLDGADICRVKTESLHAQMGIVLQSNFLFTGTVMDNIRIGKPSATDAEVVASARDLGCLDLFEGLPDGFQSVVGERGAGLSLGQRQLVCFSRAMLANPRIMILDEATSAVDTMTEARIQEALAILLKGRTSFVVAHRLSTIRHADVVLVLDHGRIVERGTHNDLLATGGVYANLYQQFIRASKA